MSARPSCPALCRASTSFVYQDVDGRVRPGHDELKESASKMFLIGQFASPFVRRVAIALRLYGIAFDHKPWSTFGDADKIAPYNPLRRGPTPVLDFGGGPIESFIILGFLAQLCGAGRRV